jgi:hypothetical protein
MTFEDEVRVFMKEMTIKTDTLVATTDTLVATMGEHSRILHTMYARRRYPQLGCKLTGELLQHHDARVHAR